MPRANVHYRRPHRDDGQSPTSTEARHRGNETLGFRITQKTRRTQVEQQGAEHGPDWATLNEEESLAFLDQDVEYEQPAILEAVAEKAGNVSCVPRMYTV